MKTATTLLTLLLSFSGMAQIHEIKRDTIYGVKLWEAEDSTKKYKDSEYFTDIEVIYSELENKDKTIRFIITKGSRIMTLDYVVIRFKINKYENKITSYSRAQEMAAETEGYPETKSYLLMNEFGGMILFEHNGSSFKIYHMYSDTERGYKRYYGGVM